MRMVDIGSKKISKRERGGRMKEVFLPDLGENIEEATISYWHCQEGDQVEERGGPDRLEKTLQKLVSCQGRIRDGRAIRVASLSPNANTISLYRPWR